MVAGLTGCKELEGKLVDLSPILAFTKFEEAHHTGEALARWKKSVLAVLQMDNPSGWPRRMVLQTTRRRTAS